MDCNYYATFNNIKMRKRKVVYKATKQDLNMNTDIEFRNKLIKTAIIWMLLATFGLIVIINLLFEYANAISSAISKLFWAFIYLIA